ncbi:mannitol dehydrogenase family protein [Maricurvus nonylphenolicus]|uniref:mannitol dehydrogenase family protein n=1 Tax=Maricurvus nonylphenolicus TaxID=1008307 RepID=UPI0036F1DCBA
MSRLNAKALAQLPEAVAVPQYVRRAIKSAIVHLGIGAFHRGHQAWYTEQVLNNEGGDWGITGVSLRSATVQQQLQPQDGLYTLLEKQGEEQRLQVIGAIKDVIVAPENPGALLSLLSDEATQVVTLTITEKGYCYDFAADSLDEKNPDILHDLEYFPFQLKTAVAYLVAALRTRRKNKLPLTVISCDNLPANGRILEKVVLAFAEKIDTTLAHWIKTSVAFPCSMVDRIVPATTPEDIASVREVLGMEDLAAVATEPFAQWVVESNFKTPVPAWDKVGALFVDDVEPFEDMKLRLLNGSHSIIAYLGYLAGYDYVHQVVADKDFAAFIRAYMDNIATPTLSMPDGFDVEAYKDQLLARFANASLNHKTSQIAQDGSQKIPQRWLASLRENGAAGRDISILALALAGWIRYLQGQRDNGETYTIIDPAADQLTAMTLRVSGSAQLVPNVLAVESIFSGLDKELPDLVAQVIDWHKQLIAEGCQSVVTSFI